MWNDVIVPSLQTSLENKTVSYAPICEHHTDPNSRYIRYGNGI